MQEELRAAVHEQLRRARGPAARVVLDEEEKRHVARRGAAPHPAARVSTLQVQLYYTPNPKP